MTIEVSTEATLKFFESVGGPAFPAEWKLPDGGALTGPGMTLRDWFAGQALAAFVGADGAQYFNRHDEHARSAYAIADAMIAERQKP